MPQKCIKCKKSGHVFTCKGCQDKFCDEHYTEHREDLSHEISNITKQCHQFDEDLNDNKHVQSYLSRIDQWEHESINKIQKAAEIARNDLLTIVDRTRTQLKSLFNKIHSDIQTNQELQTYTERNIEQWHEQLKNLRHLYETSFTDDIIDTNQSSIRPIKIINRRSSLNIDELNILPAEKFGKIVGSIELSKNGLRATCNGSNWNGSNISGTNLYSSGIHSIRFRIKKKGKNNPFFGMTSALEQSNPWNRKTPFAYGWWEFPIINDDKETPEDPFIKTGDEVTLTLNCLNNQIQFENHRTKQYVEESISYEQCPFPWKLAIVLYAPGDSVTILSN